MMGCQQPIILTNGVSEIPWINNEDMAIKYKLQGITVQDANNPARPVKVRFRLPEDELAALDYPIIIIEHLGLFPAPEREHSGYINLPYAPEVQGVNPVTNNVNGVWTTYAPWWPGTPETIGANSWNPVNDGFIGSQADSPYASWYPTPYNFDYQITVYSRKMPGHLQNIMNTLATATYIPYHFGFLNIPQDGTQRKMFLMSGPQVEYGKDNNDKRLLRAIYRVRVETELILSQSFTINGPYNALVTQIDVDLGCYSDVTDLATEEVTANFGLITTGPTYSFWNVEGQYEPAGVWPEGTIQPPVFTPRRRPSRAVTRGMANTAQGVLSQKITPEE